MSNISQVLRHAPLDREFTADELVGPTMMGRDAIYSTLCYIATCKVKRIVRTKKTVPTQHWVRTHVTPKIPVITRYIDITAVSDGQIIVVDDATCGSNVAGQHFPFGVERVGERRIAEFAVLLDAIEYAGFLIKKGTR